MKLQILSDLHLEFGPFIPEKNEADLIIVAGDAANNHNSIIKLLETFPNKPVLFVLGNHDYYHGALGYTLKKLKQDAESTHIQILNNETMIVDDVRFIGATLWTDYHLTNKAIQAKLCAHTVMNDFKLIKSPQFTRITPSVLQTEHIESLNFIKEQLETPFNGKTVVITHHLPSSKSLNSKYNREEDQLLNASYASNLDYLFSPKIDLWVHGHTHCACDYTENGTRVVCNPRGYYPFEVVEGFCPNWVIDLHPIKDPPSEEKVEATE